MFPIRLTHPVHGATHAHDTHELEKLKKAGWSDSQSRYTEAAKPEVLAIAPKQKRAYNRKAA